MNWITKYAPQSIDELILSSENRNILEKILEKPENALLHGSYGTGKSSFRKILLKKYENHIKINASDETGIDNIRNRVKKFIRAANPFTVLGYNESHKIVVFEESDGLSQEAQKMLKEESELFPDRVAFIFVTNELDKINKAIQSRCKMVNFDNINKKDIVSDMKNGILRKENIKNDIEDVKAIVDKHHPSVRDIIQVLDQFSNNGTLNISSLGLETETQGTISRSLKTGEERRQVDRARSRRWSEEQKNQHKKQISCWLSEKAHKRLLELKGTKSYSQAIEDLILDSE